MGKTTWLKKLLHKRSHVLVFDPNHEYADLVPEPEYDFVSEPLGAVSEGLNMLGWTNLFAQQRPVEKAAGRHVVVEGGDFDGFLDLVEAADGYTVAIDEAHLMWETHKGRIDKLMRTMRHREQDWFFVSHRVSWTPKSIQSQVDWFIVFRQTLGGDLTALERDFPDVDVEAVPGLGVGQFLDVEISPRATW